MAFADVDTITIFVTQIFEISAISISISIHRSIDIDILY